MKLETDDLPWDPAAQPSFKGLLLRRLVALCTLGNLAYEAGDLLWGKIEFIHAFSSEEAIRSELEEGGLTVMRILKGQIPITGGAICRKGL